MKIALSTRNKSKVEQIKTAFAKTKIKIVTLDELGIKGQAVEDNFPSATIRGNALKKARFARENIETSYWAMAEDTGLFIEALNGEPGAMAATWAGIKASAENIERHTLDRIFCIKNCQAKWETVIALISPDGKEYFFSGEVTGILLNTPKNVVMQPNMPYSRIFVPNGTKKVWAEMTVEEENAISHRGKAVRAALEFLEKESRRPWWSKLLARWRSP